MAKFPTFEQVIAGKNQATLAAQVPIIARNLGDPDGNACLKAAGILLVLSGQLTDDGRRFLQLTPEGQRLLAFVDFLGRVEAARLMQKMTHSIRYQGGVRRNGTISHHQGEFTVGDERGLFEICREFLDNLEDVETLAIRVHVKSWVIYNP